MDNATFAALTAERDSLRAAFIRYITLDQVVSNTGLCHGDFDYHLDNLQDALHGGALEEVIRELAASVEDVVLDVLAECETFRTDAD